MPFSIYEERIILVLGRSARPLSIDEISKAGRISWITARKHLLSLEKRGVASKNKTGKRLAWRLNLG